MYKVYKNINISTEPKALEIERTFCGVIDDATVRNARRIDDYDKGYSRLIFEIMPDNEAFILCELENYIVNEDGEYVIKSVSHVYDGWYQIICEPNLEAWQNIIIDTFDAFRLDPYDFLNLIISYVPGWSVVFEAGGEHGTSATVQKSLITPQYALACFDFKTQHAYPHWYDTLNKILHVYQYSPSTTPHYGKTVPEIIFSSQTGLQKIIYNAHSYDLYTESLPIGWKDLRVGLVNNGNDWISNYNHCSKSIQHIYQTNSKHAETLLNNAGAYLAYYSKPIETFRINLLDIGNVGIGDAVVIYDQIHDRKLDTQVVILCKYYNTPELSYVILSEEPIDFTYDITTELKDAKSQIRHLRQEIEDMQQ